MTEAEVYFYHVGTEIQEAEKSQLFGKPCFKFSGKAFVCFFKECMVFKLTSPEHSKALEMEGAELFDPSGKGRPMKEWVQVPYAHQSEWESLAQSALSYLKTLL